MLTLKERYLNLVSKILKLSERLNEDKAKEYLLQGVARRLDVIERCVENVYSIFPLQRKELLSHDELKDVDINLHAFIVNVFGILENLAWVLIHEKGLTNILDKKKVGLFKKETKSRLSSEFRQYLDSNSIKAWHDQFLANYRDALSHRIPLYVPPKALTSEQKEQVVQAEKQLNDSIRLCDFDTMKKILDEDERIGDPCPLFIHSISEEDSKHIVFHAQIIADFNTVEEVVNKFCETFDGHYIPMPFKMEEWLQNITKDIISVFHHLDLFKKLNDIITNNTKLAEFDSILLSWMRESFTVDLVIGIGRICDMDSRTNSLVSFLHELKRNPEFLTRARYIGLYEAKDSLTLEIANRTFNDLAGQGKEIYHTEEINKDITALTKDIVCKKILDFRNQYIAHSDKDKIMVLPTYDDLFKTFKVIEEIAKKYNLLLRATNILDLTPTIQGNWEEALTIPWLVKEDV